MTVHPAAIYFEIQSKCTNVTCALTGRRPMHPAADDDFEN